MPPCINSASHVNRLSGNVAAIHKIAYGRRELPVQFLYSSEDKIIAQYQSQ